jgi:CRISPR/Cas system-associated protein Csx1
VIDCGDNLFGTAFKRLLRRAIAIARRREDLMDTTLRQYQAALSHSVPKVCLPILRPPKPAP